LSPNSVNRDESKNQKRRKSAKEQTRNMATITRITFSLTAAWATSRRRGITSNFLKHYTESEIKDWGIRTCVLVDLLRDVLFEGKEPQAKGDLIAHLRPGIVFEDIDNPGKKVEIRLEG
jgi:hypothetical protein